MHDPADIRIRPEKLDAIHRALLAGLLGNVGQKTDTHEYAGARGSKFSIFPGSALFSSRPSWVMSAEIVETTKLYARTNARIRPEWIERIGAHLMKRQYSEPYWKSTSGYVMAFEKVSLYGLVIVPRRSVHFGPIDPVTSREFFIHHALVEMDFHSLGEFLKHNRRLVDDVLTLEAKARHRDLLASRDARYAFFAARVPPGIYNSPLFEKWREKAERKDPRILFLSMSDVLNEDVAKQIELAHFPDALRLGDLRFELTYLFEPGHEMDGVTATIPLAALNQVPALPFQWLVPGHLKETITTLIKSLPKALRVNFIPVPEFAQKAYEALASAWTMDNTIATLPTAPLLDALATQLGKLSGLPVRAADFQLDALPDYLRMNFRIVDDSGGAVIVGRDLDVIRKQLGIRAKATFANLPKTEYHRDDITHWDFGDLPQRIELNINGITLNGYPALVDNGATVSMRLFDSQDSARSA